MERLSLRQSLGAVSINKILTFYPNGSYKLDLKLSGNARYFISPGSRPNVEVDSYTVHGVIVGKPGEAGISDKIASFFTSSQAISESVEIFKDGDVDKNERISGANIAASSDRYYTTLFYGESLNATVIDADKISKLAARLYRQLGLVDRRAYAHHPPNPIPAKLQGNAIDEQAKGFDA